jgi:hypothetical protein
MVEQQTAALEGKDRESTQLRARLSKMQKEAEDNERKVDWPQHLRLCDLNLIAS